MLVQLKTLKKKYNYKLNVLSKPLDTTKIQKQT